MNRLLMLLTLGLLMLVIQPVSAEVGVTADHIVIGRSAGMTGPLVARMKPATEAMEAAFNEINKAGGIHGRKIVFINLDDGNVPARAVENTRALIDKHKVFALFSQSGTPQTQATIPVFTKAGVPMLGTSSGADSVRTLARDHLFHLKASYGTEMAKIAGHFDIIGIRRVAIVFSEDGTGREGRDVAQAALRKVGIEPVAVIGLKTKAAAETVARVAAAEAQAIVLVTLAGPGAEFYGEFAKLPASERPQVYAWSIIAVESIYQKVGEVAQGMVVTQIVPPPTRESMTLVRDYHRALRASGFTDGGYPGLEAYIGARVLIEALQRTGPNLDRKRFVRAVRRMRNVDLGGDFVDFGEGSNVGRHYVDMTMVGAGGKFVR